MKRITIGVVAVMLAAASVWAAGATIGISFGDVIVDCLTRTVTADYTITATAADAAAVSETLTQGSTVVRTNSYNIPAGNTVDGWAFAGRTKTHDGQFVATGLPDGTYTLQVCATQAGSGGNAAKMDCQTQTIVVACAAGNTSPCANTAPFGEVVGRKKITGQATVQINFAGDFGPNAFVEIKKDGSTVGSANVPRNGDSCNYHASWKFTTGSGSDIYGNTGAGVYQVTVTGNGQDPLVFSVTLED